jgi:hypothetical protein
VGRAPVPHFFAGWAGSGQGPRFRRLPGATMAGLEVPYRHAGCLPPYASSIMSALLPDGTAMMGALDYDTNVRVRYSMMGAA